MLTRGVDPREDRSAGAGLAEPVALGGLLWLLGCSGRSWGGAVTSAFFALFGFVFLITQYFQLLLGYGPARGRYTDRARCRIRNLRSAHRQRPSRRDRHGRCELRRSSRAHPRLRRRHGSVRARRHRALQLHRRSPRRATVGELRSHEGILHTLGEGLRHELRPLGIDVLVSAPGPVDSGFDERAATRMGGGMQPDDVAQSTMRALGRHSVVRPGVMAKLLGWSLASGASSAISPDTIRRHRTQPADDDHDCGAGLGLPVAPRPLRSC